MIQYPDAVIDPSRRHDFVLLFDVTDGNPNGDPDAGNLPRVDPETMQGIVTDVAIKRKVRDYVYLTHSEEKTRQIYVKHRGILINQQKMAYESLGYNDGDKTAIEDARAWMCQHFYDVRLFGAVMSTKKFNAGQVRGPVQLTFARSIDPVVPLDISITRVALTNATDVKGGTEDDTEAASSQMGRKAYIPYGLYRMHGFFSPAFAQDTGVNEEDLSLFWESLVRMWEFDRSAARGFMACRGLYVFTHDHPLGNAPAHRLFQQINVKKKEGVKVARSFQDYQLQISEDSSSGVTLHRLAD